jgi:hypothetical protein
VADRDGDRSAERLYGLHEKFFARTDTHRPKLGSEFASDSRDCADFAGLHLGEALTVLFSLSVSTCARFFTGVSIVVPSHFRPT